VENAFWGSGPGDVWNGANHWDGYAWAAAPAEFTDVPLRGECGNAPDDVWAVAAEGGIYHWNGTNWALIPISTLRCTGPDFTGVWCGGPDNVWAVDDTGEIYHLYR
jgi:hypothetical protein